MYTIEDYRESAGAIEGRLGGFRPEVLMILGSGLGSMASEVDNAVVIPYGEIPHFPVSTAPGHAGNLVLGRMGGKKVAVFQGRVHCYEGHSMETVAYGTRVLRMLGADKLIITNASGAVNREYSPGDIVLIADHIKLFPGSPLIGPNLPEFGPRFPDSSYAYSTRLRALAKEAAKELNIALREGVYMFFPGPQYETPAEIRAARALGADVVGMSTVPEAIAANHAGMEILGFSLATNMAAGILDRPLTEKEVLEAGERARESFASLIRLCLERM
jgi:purine-nucleoside phosphorylase